uniref:NAD(+) kinase n=1 Tax=Strongyloides papillosus TaxID=174720 RepID=A0A0N5BBF9_STREA
MSSINFDFGNLNNEEIISKLHSFGIVTKEVKEKHLAHLKFVNKIVVAFKKQGLKVRIINCDQYNQKCFKGFDLIVTAGGDGTFLFGASKIKSDTPLIGLNSDPQGSEGYLCVERKMNIPPHIIIKKYIERNFEWYYRQRITVTIKHRKFYENEKKYENKNTVLENDETHYALNEIFIGEINVSKVSYFEVSFNDKKPIKQKNSGISICTGTGSTAWHYNINKLNKNKLEKIINVLKDMGVNFKGKNEQFIDEVCNRFNEQLIFNPSHCEMAYTLREPIFNNTFCQIPQTGFIRKMKIISKCSNGCIVVDGNNSIPIYYGTEIVLQMFPEDALRTVFMDFDNSRYL